MTPLNKRLLISLIVGLLISSACRVSINSNDPTASPTSTPQTASPVQTDFQTEVVPTIEPTPTISPTPEPDCESSQTPPPLEQTIYEEYPNTILVFINNGAKADDIQSALDAIGNANQPIAASEGDVTGDGKSDMVVSIINQDSFTNPPQGALIIYTCQAGQYALTHIEVSQEFFGAPAIILILDLNADGINELIISSKTCGASTCFESIQILSWNGASFVNLLDGDTSDLPFPDVQITDFAGDGIYQLEVASGVYGSVGAGPQREVIRTWAYNLESGFWEFSNETLGISNYRIHAVHDADAALDRAEYPVAIVLYEQIISNRDMTDWIDPDLELHALGAYARYKTVVAMALNGEIDRANIFLIEFSRIYRSNQSPYIYYQLAAVFLESFLLGGQEGGCTAAHQFAAVNADKVLVPLGSLTYGYANPDYSPLDICP